LGSNNLKQNEYTAGSKISGCKRKLITQMEKGLSLRSTECIPRQRSSESGTRRVAKEGQRNS